MDNRRELDLTLEPMMGEVLPITLLNAGGVSCPPYSFVAILRGPGYIRPVRFDSAIDMKPGDSFRFELTIRASEQLTLRFERGVDVYFKNEAVPDNMISFPKH
ncbi:MAG: hypothetical protein ACRCWO_07410 [Bosea sp. (in: a-proteobacteria)]